MLRHVREISCLDVVATATIPTWGIEELDMFQQRKHGQPFQLLFITAGVQYCHVAVLPSRRLAATNHQQLQVSVLSINVSAVH
jgi:hypothetical protein